ncbi:MAG TPA: aldolase [bacterium]|nr:aldolase [bacterium]
MTDFTLHIPADVPKEMRAEYEKNYRAITCNSGNLMLFAGDQKVEHLNDDFYGDGIAEEDIDPEHLFKIASSAKIGVFASQLGLIARYGADYPDVRYMVKMNSKTHLIPTEQRDPMSSQWYDVEQVVEFKENSGLQIMAVGYTVYIGSEFEHEQLQQAAQVIYEAHQYGLVTALWMYPRGKAVKDEKCPHLIAGATGTAACLGTDFVKVNYPKREGEPRPESFKEAIKAAGRTKVVCAGGGSMGVDAFLQQLHDQIHISGAVGNATGRNIHQRPFDEAVRLCNAIYAVTVEGADVATAMKIYHG